MPHRILHLSDTHVTGSGFDQDGVDALASLDQILRDCRHLAGLDLVVVTGDIADDGSAEGCALIRDRVGRFAEDRGIPHVYTTGNHDRRPGFTTALGTGHFDAQGTDAGQLMGNLGGERAAVSVVGGVRLITLDSLVPGSVHGVVSQAQLRALGELLRDPTPAGTVLALHHPPIHTPTAPWMDETSLRKRDHHRPRRTVLTVFPRHARPRPASGERGLRRKPGHLEGHNRGTAVNTRRREPPERSRKRLPVGVCQDVQSRAAGGLRPLAAAGAPVSSAFTDTNSM